MGKNDFLTPKAIANRIKSKGLQKLRWYCQMCQKQCRDENGFKCHLTSESHKRQMMVFGENPDRVIDGYSEEFEWAFLEHLRIAHPSSRVSAQVVYNEFIADKHHIHMNSTKWLTLTDFVKYLGRTGKCKVDQTEKGWHIVYVKKDIGEELEEGRKSKRQKADKEEEERQQDYLQAQIERAKQTAKQDEGPSQATELHRDDNGGGAILQMAIPKLSKMAPIAKSPAVAFTADDANGASGGRLARPKSKQEEIMEREQAQRKRQAEKAKESEKQKQAEKPGRADAPWLMEGIIVKVKSKDLKAHGYYNEKGFVEKVVSKYVGQIQMLKKGDILLVDQAQLETVLPTSGGSVKILTGQHQGTRAVLESIDTAKFQAQIKLESGESCWMEYEDISKLA